MRAAVDRYLDWSLTATATHLKMELAVAGHRRDGRSRGSRRRCWAVIATTSLAHNRGAFLLRDCRRRGHVVAMVAYFRVSDTAADKGAFKYPHTTFNKGSASATSSAAFFPDIICVSMHETGDSMFA